MEEGRLLMLYPAYGTVSCHEVCRHAEEIGDFRMILADDAPTTSDLDIFHEVWELPPPEDVSGAYELMRRWCDEERPDGLFLQSERGLLLGSLLVREFGLIGPSVEAAHLCSNKYLQRVTLSRAGIGNPDFALVEDEEGVERFGERFGFPLVLKCVISTMSRLVTLVESKEQVSTAVERMQRALKESRDVKRLLSFASTAPVDLGCDPTRQFLAESFMGGDKIETDGLVVRERPFTFGVSEQIQSSPPDPPFFIEAYLLPAECTPNDEVEAVSDATIAAIGLRNSAFSIEMRSENGKIRIVEVNGRLGWDEGFSDLFKVRTHAERIAQAQQLALGMDIDTHLDTRLFASLAYRSCYYDAIVEKIPSVEEARALSSDSVQIGLATHRGARFVAPPDPEAYPHVAWALATDRESSRAALEAARRALDSLEIVLRRV